MSKQVCRKFNTPKGCNFGAGCRFKHEKEDGAKVERISCRFFQTKKGCKKGSSCPFSHGDVAVASSMSAAAASSSAQVPAPERATASDPVPKKQCDAFTKTGKCSRGSSCRFAHVGKEQGRAVDTRTYTQRQFDLIGKLTGICPKGMLRNEICPETCPLYHGLNGFLIDVHRPHGMQLCLRQFTNQYAMCNCDQWHMPVVLRTMYLAIVYQDLSPSCMEALVDGLQVRFQQLKNERDASVKTAPPSQSPTPPNLDSQELLPPGKKLVVGDCWGYSAAETCDLCKLKLAGECNCPAAE